MWVSTAENSCWGTQVENGSLLGGDCQVALITGGNPAAPITARCQRLPMRTVDAQDLVVCRPVANSRVWRPPA